jgi:WD40 repeat protein
MKSWPWLCCFSLLLPTVPVAGAEPPRIDALGDPLPPHAIARLGTTRWRQPWYVASLAASADGRLLVCPPGVLDAASGRLLRQLCEPDYASLCTAISADGKRAAAFLNGVVHVFDTGTGDRIGRFPLGGRRWNRFVLSPDGSKIVLCHEEDGAGLWDVDSGKNLATFPEGYFAAFAHDGKTLVLSSTRQVGIWDVTPHKEVWRWETETWQMAVAADGRTVATLGKKAVRLWDPDTGKEKRSLALPGEETSMLLPSALALSADGRTVALASNRHLLAWDCATGKERFRRLDAGWSSAVALSPDGQTLIWGLVDGPTIHRWDLVADKELVAAPGHEYGVEAVSFAPDGSSLATGDDHTVRLWKLAAPAGSPGPSSPTGDAPLTIPASQSAWLSDGKLLTAALSAETASLRDTSTGKAVWTLPDVKMLSAFAASADGKYVAIGGYYLDGQRVRGRVFVCAVSTGQVVRTLEGQQGIAHSVAFSPDGKRLASGMDCVRVWGLATGREWRRLPEVTRHCKSLAFTADGSKLVAAGTPASRVLRPEGSKLLPGTPARVWDLETGEEVQRVGDEQKGVRAIALSADNRVLATAGSDDLVWLWDFTTGAELARLNAADPTALAFSADGRTLASGSRDTTVLLWDVSAAIRGAGNTKARLVPTKEELARLWDDLGRAGREGERAVWTLADNPQEAVALIKERLPRRGGADAERLAKLIKQLDDDLFERREQAAKEVDGMGRAAVPALREALRRDPSAEVRRRIETLLAKHDARPRLLPEGELRMGRAIQVLELIGTPEAREVLRGLRDGPLSPGSDDARAALERLDRRRGGKP